MTASALDREQVSTVIEQYRRGFATLSAEDLMGLWDPDYDDLVYVALEETTPRLGWNAIEAYYHAALTTDPTFRVVSMRVDALSVGVLENVAHVFCQFRFEGEQVDHPELVIAEGHATFVLRRHRTVWKVIHYHESALAPPRN